MTSRAELIYIACCKLLIAACAVAVLVLLTACSCKDWHYCPPTLAPRADQ